jgi:hypothetical protein
MIPMSGSNVSGTPLGANHLRDYYEDKGLMFFNDVAEPREGEPEPVRKPEPLKRVRVLPPFMVAHEGTQYFPNSVAEVPESVADNWLLNQWVVSDETAAVPADLQELIEPEQPRKRGTRR